MNEEIKVITDRENTYSKKWNEEEDSVLPFSIADMEFLSPNSVVNDIVKRAEHGIYGYTIKSSGYFESIINWNYERNNWEIKEEDICHSPGIVTALNLIIQTYTKKGEGIVIQTPVYYPFINSIKNNDRKVIYNELIRVNEDYKIDYEDLENKLKDEKVKLFFFCSPHNPIGKVWSNEDIVKIGKLCKEHNVIVISDEVHSDILLNGHKHYCMASISKEFSENTITCISPSKTFNLAGLQTSAIIIPNENLRAQYQKTLESLSLNKVTPFGLVGLESAYRNGDKWLAELNKKLEKNVTFMKENIDENIPHLNLSIPEGTYLAWIDCKSLNLSDEGLENFMVKKAKINVRHGYVFGPGGSGFIRFNFACSIEMIKEGLDRIKNAVNNN